MSNLWYLQNNKLLENKVKVAINNFNEIKESCQKGEYSHNQNLIGRTMVSVYDVLSLWVGNNALGCSKEESLETIYQQFFNEFYDFLLYALNDKNKDLKQLANNVLYKGPICRYLGYARENDNQHIVPIFNGKWSSWSKGEENQSIAKCFIGKVTRIVSNTHNYYGIDLTALGFSIKGEEEIIFPMLETNNTKFYFLSGS